MTKKFAFMLAPRTHFLDLAGPDQVLFEAIYFGAPFQLEYYSILGEASSASGLRFAALAPYHEAQLQAGDYLIIPGMDLSIVTDRRDLLPQHFLDWILDCHVRGVNICSVCTGAFVLAASGLLDGRTCTTHWKYTQKLQKLFPRVNVVENILFTVADGCYTSAGIASGIDMALHIVEQEGGASMAHKVAREIVVYMRRSGREPQQSLFLTYRNHIHAGVHLVQDWLAEHLNEKPTIEALAEMANMSTRNFTRTFKQETGITVGEYVAMLRKERVKELMKNPDFSRSQVAGLVGLGSERQLRRLLQA